MYTDLLMKMLNNPMNGASHSLHDHLQGQLISRSRHMRRFLSSINPQVIRNHDSNFNRGDALSKM